MPTDSEPVQIWTDGGCKPNPGPRRLGRHPPPRQHVEKELTGGDPVTTNNRMELTAAAAALEALTRPCKVVVQHRQRIRQERHHPLAHRLGPPQLAQLGR